MTMAARVTIPSGEVYRISLNEAPGDAARVTIPAGECFRLICEGLVSDKQTIQLTGWVKAGVSTVSAETDVTTLLHPANALSLYVATERTELNVVRELASELALHAGWTGGVTVERVFAGTDAHIGAATRPGVLSGSVYAMMAEWTDNLLSELETMSLDDMIYKEV